MAAQGLYKFCKKTGTVLPKDEADVLDHIERKPVKFDGSLDIPSEGRGGWFKFCKTTGSVLPVGEARERDRLAKNAFTSDEMPPTKHPLTKEYYTSREKFREVTRAHGYEEVGDAYERGHDPEAESLKAVEAAEDRRFRESLREHRQAGKEYIKARMDEYRRRSEENRERPVERRVTLRMG